MYYLSFWYTRKQQAVRLSYMVAGSFLAGALGGLIAFGIGFIDGSLGLSGWQWLFLIEGIITLIISFLVM